MKTKNSYNPDARNIALLPRPAYKEVLVIISKSEQINHNLLHQYFPNATFSFLSNRTEKEDNSKGMNYTLHKKDFFFKTLKNERLKNLTKKTFDLLIDLNEDNDKLIYFVENINAGLKIGCFNKPNNHLYDILTKPSLEIVDVVNSMVKQLDILTLNNKK
ncbi:hypothetical protein DNU06_06295 [Putridiphycobacter roseus]|uniref:Uncharacterized protein n=1 Tax=Putridiphycobacter roseus TaxID=2219161 RepID=A0A2W1NRH1_9FLAO|nr:hypothetical protein [Putridiphycobacter roseus]PZE18222.1 hypothetical protein DNU06_06295 [Putridiphycobacter roseus]